MNESPESNLSPTEETQAILDSLRQSVSKALERKRHLGHYAVIWQDGKAVAIGEDAPPANNEKE